MKNIEQLIDYFDAKHKLSEIILLGESGHIRRIILEDTKVFDSEEDEENKPKIPKEEKLSKLELIKKDVNNLKGIFKSI